MTIAFHLPTMVELFANHYTPIDMAEIKDIYFILFVIQKARLVPKQEMCFTVANLNIIYCLVIIKFITKVHFL